MNFTIHYVALAANVLIGVLDPTDALHRRALTLLGRHEQDRPIMSAVAYAAVLVRAAHDGYAEAVDRAVDHAGIEVVALDRAIARRAAALRSRHKALPMPDALVLATAHERNVPLLTLDKRLARLT